MTMKPYGSTTRAFSVTHHNERTRRAAELTARKTQRKRARDEGRRMCRDADDETT